jgi:hypothetical protein
MLQLARTGAAGADLAEEIVERVSPSAGCNGPVVKVLAAHVGSYLVLPRSREKAAQRSRCAEQPGALRAAQEKRGFTDRHGQTHIREIRVVRGANPGVRFAPSRPRQAGSDCIRCDITAFSWLIMAA